MSRIQTGQTSAAKELLPLVYSELRKMAAAALRKERPGQTLQPTALVNEVWLRLEGDQSVWDRRSREAFFSAAGAAMRRILVDAARRKRRLKNGGHLHRVRYDEDSIVAPELRHDLIDLDAALTRLATVDPLSAHLIELRNFAGLNLTEAADVLGISIRTADRVWSFAKAWLHREITTGGENMPNS